MPLSALSRRRYGREKGPKTRPLADIWSRAANSWLTNQSAAAQAVDEIGEAHLPGATQPLGGNDRLHQRDAVLDVAVDDQSYSGQWLISAAKRAAALGPKQPLNRGDRSAR